MSLDDVCVPAFPFRAACRDRRAAARHARGRARARPRPTPTPPSRPSGPPPSARPSWPASAPPPTSACCRSRRGPRSRLRAPAPRAPRPALGWMLTAAAAGLVVGVGTGQGIYVECARARAMPHRAAPMPPPRARRRRRPTATTDDAILGDVEVALAGAASTSSSRSTTLTPESDAGRVPVTCRDGPARGHLSQGPRSQGRRRRRAVGRLRQQPRRGDQGRRLPLRRRPPDRPPRARVRLLLRRRSRRRLRLPGAAAVRRSAGLPDRRNHPQPATSTTSCARPASASSPIPANRPSSSGPADVVILPAFGVSVGELADFQARGCTLVDTTCGSVLNVWKNVTRYARDGFTALIHGKYKHEETRATASQALTFPGGRYLVVLDRAEADVVCDYIRARRRSRRLPRPLRARRLARLRSRSRPACGSASPTRRRC